MPIAQNNIHVSNPMLYDFIHISDTQLVPEGKINYDIDPYNRLRCCIDDIVKFCPDSRACIITGDLAHWGEEAAYQLLKKELRRLPFPCWLLMGNHDSRKAFCQVFGHEVIDEKGFVQFSLSTPAGRLVGLDTLEEGRRGGYLCSWRLQWLEQELSKGDPVFLFMHHPPFKLGLPSMDDDGLLNSDDFLDVIHSFPGRICHLFFGHVHRSVSGSWRGISYSCPLSLVHQTPFDFVERKVTAVSPESPQYHRVQIYGDRVVVHARDFLHSDPLIDVRRCTRYPRPCEA